MWYSGLLVCAAKLVEALFAAAGESLGSTSFGSDGGPPPLGSKPTPVGPAAHAESMKPAVVQVVPRVLSVGTRTFAAAPVATNCVVVASTGPRP
jgi:hypothetical protein